jgi:cobalt/nickel transport system ATP-binding protein
MSEPLLAADGLCFGYAGRPILQDVGLRLDAGERLALLGANGAGKSTLLHLLVGLLRPDAGRIRAFGRDCRNEADFRQVRAGVGLVFQDPDDQLFCPTVLEDVAFGPLNLGQSADEARATALATLAELGLAGLAERVGWRLSAGEKRLVALATVLAMRPRVLLLDEPTNGLDTDAEERLIRHLERLPQAMILVSHDQCFLTRLATRAAILEAGRLVDAALHSHAHTHRHVHLHVHGPDTAAHGGEGAPPHPDHHAAESPEGPRSGRSSEL